MGQTSKERIKEALLGLNSHERHGHETTTQDKMK